LTTFLFWMQKRHFLREIGQCFGELYLKKGYVLFKYINLFFLSMWDQTWLLFIFFFIIIQFFLWYQKRAGLLNYDDFFLQIIFHFIFSQLVFSVAVIGVCFFWLFEISIHLISIQLISFLSFCFFWSSTIIIYKVMYNRDHECHQMVKCINIFLFVFST